MIEWWCIICPNMSRLFIPTSSACWSWYILVHVHHMDKTNFVHLTLLLKSHLKSFINTIILHNNNKSLHNNLVWLIIRRTYMYEIASWTNQCNINAIEKNGLWNIYKYIQFLRECTLTSLIWSVWSIVCSRIVCSRIVCSHIVCSVSSAPYRLLTYRLLVYRLLPYRLLTYRLLRIVCSRIVCYWALLQLITITLTGLSTPCSSTCITSCHCESTQKVESRIIAQ